MSKQMLELTDKWAVEFDELNLILKRKTTPKPGNDPRWAAYGYYGKWAHLFERLVDQEVMAGDSIKEIVDKQDQLYELIKTLFAKIDYERFKAHKF